MKWNIYFFLVTVSLTRWQQICSCKSIPSQYSFCILIPYDPLMTLTWEIEQKGGQIWLWNERTCFNAHFYFLGCTWHINAKQLAKCAGSISSKKYCIAHFYLMHLIWTLFQNILNLMVQCKDVGKMKFSVWWDFWVHSPLVMLTQLMRSLIVLWPFRRLLK